MSACPSRLVLAPLPSPRGCSSDTFLYKTLLFTATAYAHAVARPVARPDARGPSSRGSDLSYGTYLYGWPVQQALHALHARRRAAGPAGPALALTLAVAALSWFAVEKPALALKARGPGPSNAQDD